MKSRRHAYLQLAVLISGILTVVLWGAVSLTSQEKLLQIAFLDVGQGDAIYIEAPNGSQVLIDGGKNPAVLRELSKVMPFWDRSIDLVVASHPHADHIAGLVDVLERYKIDYVMDVGLANYETPTLVAYEEAVGRSGAEKITPIRGTTITLDENVILTVLSEEVVSASDPNEASIILRLDYGDSSFIFTGDATAENERELLRYHHMLPADVLKVGHHGSNTSTSKEFVSAITPDIAVISVGKNNSYGHPTEKTLNTLEAQKVKILRTDKDGTVRFVSDGKLIREKRFSFLAKLFHQ